MYVIGIGRLLSPLLQLTKAEPLGLEMDANPVTKGAGPRRKRVSKTFGIQRWEGIQSFLGKSLILLMP